MTTYHYQLNKFTVSLDDIKNGILRNNTSGHLKLFRPLKKGHPALQYTLETDPRIHMALHCAAKSSAKFYGYHAEYLEQQLNIAACEKLEREVFLNGAKLSLPRFFLWYKKDFGGKNGILNFIIKYHPDRELAQRITDSRPSIRFQWQHFDWSINQL